MVYSSELRIHERLVLVLELERNWGHSEKLIDLSLNLVFTSSSVAEISDKMLFPDRHSNWRNSFLDRRFLWHNILWWSFLRQVLVVISLDSVFLVFSNLVNDRLDLMVLDSFGFELFAVSSVLVIEELLIINFHLFKLLVVNLISFNKLVHFFFMLLLFSLDVICHVGDLGVNVVAFLHEHVGVVSGVVDLLDPLLFLSVHFVLVFSF